MFEKLKGLKIGHIRLAPAKGEPDLYIEDAEGRETVLPGVTGEELRQSRDNALSRLIPEAHAHTVYLLRRARNPR